MNKTSIEWVKNPDGTQGYTWNPITGCLNGCEYCYARKLANTRLRETYLANTYVSWRDKPFALEPIHNPFHPRFWADRIEGLITRNEYLDGDLPRPTKRKGIFVCDMSDLFGNGVPEGWTKRVLDTIDWNKGYDRFYLLTKQPQNLIKFSPFPDNCWVGVSITTLDLAREAIAAFAQIEAKVKFASYEPCFDEVPCNHILGLLDWLIIGSQTKPFRPPSINKVEEIVRACDKAGIPVFLKNNLEPLLVNYPYSDLLWEDLAHLRQEMPR